MTAIDKARSEMNKALYEALLAVQKVLPVIPRDSRNPFHEANYASLQQITSIALPILHEHDLLVFQRPSFDEGVVRVITVITHVPTGASIHCVPGALCDGKAQSVGSAITYLKRYGFSALLCLVTEDQDDDGARASLPAEEEKTSGEKDFEEDKQKKRATENRVKIANMIMEMVDDDKERAKYKLEALTKWTTGDGKDMPGRTSVKDIPDKGTFPVLKDVEEAYKQWNIDKIPGGDEDTPDFFDDPPER